MKVSREPEGVAERALMSSLALGEGGEPWTLSSTASAPANSYRDATS